MRRRDEGRGTRDESEEPKLETAHRLSGSIVYIVLSYIGE